MASQITANLPTLDFPREVDYPTQEDWAAFSAAAEENFGILGGDWSTQMQLWKTEANAMSIELNNSADIAQSAVNYKGDWISQGYALNESVSIGGIYYICKLTHATGQNPTDSESLYWNLALGNWSLKADKTEVALKIDKDISPYTSKTTPVDADLIPLSDSASSFGIKKVTWANLIGNIKNIAYKSIPIIIPSWSYSGKTITINVASHTFVAGDYIEVAGLTATTYPANGIQLVTSVTATTIVFTLGITPTGTTGVSSATVKGYATINGRVSESIGINQTWQDVTSLRVSGVTYSNTMGKPITIKLSSNGQNCNNTFTVGGVTLPPISINGPSGTNSTINDMCIVPASFTYSANILGTSVKWLELR